VRNYAPTELLIRHTSRPKDEEMSISSGAAALARLAHRSARSGGSPAGRALKNVAIVVGLPAAYLAGGRRGHAAEQVQLDRIAELELRIERLESAASATAAAAEPRRLRAVATPVPVDKDRVASHYEVLASQLACERQIVELEDRLAAVERTGDKVRPVPVWLASANGTIAELHRRG
jgi:hypothetical protein